MTELIFQKIYNEALDILSEKLPEHLTYHCLNHTLYVLDRAVYIGKKEGLNASEIYLIKIAALYHDMGFTKSHTNHEEEGCKMAKILLKKYELSENEIQTICGMIMATKIPQTPKNKLETILADADLEYLGTSRFTEVSELLYQELLHFNPELTRNKWNSVQVDFLGTHQYHTNFCKRYKHHRKLKNLEMLKQKLNNHG